MNTGTILELVLTLILAVTLAYCVLLERRLVAVRRGQEGLKSTIGELNTAISNAGASIRALKVAASDAADTLDERLSRARISIDELSLLTASGERIAERFDRATTRQTVARTTPSNLPSGTVMSRLDSLRAVR